MKELDHLNVDLGGMNLIEASAGTGKTYAIACLYLRLVVEKDLAPAQILVVTYTEAATKELRGRIRSRIREAMEVLDGAATKDLFLAALAESLPQRGILRTEARQRLERALTSFDTASIFTIHGFCLRALQDNAFESGSLYTTELVADQASLLQEIVDDFWRMRFFTEPAPLLAYALRKRYSPQSLMAFVKEMVANPQLEILPRFTPEEIQGLEENCRRLFSKIRDVWTRSRDEIAGILCGHKGLSRSAENYKPELIPDLLEGMMAFVGGENVFDLFEGFEKFCTGHLERKRLKKTPPPEHEFFDLCDELRSLVENRFLCLRWELISFCRERLPLRKRERNVRFFDDLLNDLYTALCSPAGPALAATLGNKYRAALIDEFQDTDPVQYEIFRLIYGSSSSPLVLIGDPKQAIYSFRGADIFAYMKAAQDVPPPRRFTLTGNWRSTPGLLEAFNVVFGGGPRPFVFDEIAYHPVTSGRKEAEEGLSLAGEAAPLQVWYMPAAGEGGDFKVGDAHRLIPPAVAAEIARLLREGAEGRARIGERPVVPGDMAVIVRSHLQAGRIQEALRARGIPSVMRSDKSIFATAEACEICSLLRAVADPGNEVKVRSALVTDLLGRRGNEIALLMEDEQRWEACLEDFRSYHHLWLERGVMVMAQSLMAREGVRGRLLRRRDGERRLTNVLHCFELLHQKAHERGLGIEGLLTWFSERIAAGDADEEYQIRLETDDKAVKIVTVHVSKGLEYPIVFCPYLWGGVRGADEVVTFHEGFTMVKDFGSSDFDRHRALAQKEALAESLRLLYVALTRARYRCYLFGGKIADKTGKNRPETSPLSYLFHAAAEERGAEALVESLAGEVSALSAEEMEAQLRRLADQAPEHIAVSCIPEAAEEEPSVAGTDDGVILSARTFSALIRDDWRVASFSSLSAHDHNAAELPDRDAPRPSPASPVLPLSEAAQERSIFTLQKGAQTGILLHGIFEALDFSAPSDEAIRAVVEKELDKFGYDREWLPVVGAMVRRVLSLPLPSPGGTFSLGDLQAGSWICELEFFFPLSFVKPDRIGAALKRWDPRQAPVDPGEIVRSLNFKPVRGLLRGFIDMVFEHQGRYYIVDWKSNHLGSRLEDYGKEGLRKAMEQNLYPLQYLLYTVALNRYLALRVKDYEYGKHFGGVFYVFLRGVSPRHGESFGLFRDIPPAPVIEELTAHLIGAGG